MNSFKDKHSNYRLRSPHASQQHSHAVKNRNHVFDSQGPTGKARGTSVQLVDKYVSLGREASAMGDTVMCEYFFQYAEHYRRITQEFHRRAKQAERTESHSSEHVPSEDLGRFEHERHEKHEKQSNPVPSLELNPQGNSRAVEPKHPRNYRKKQTRPLESKEVSAPVINGTILSAPGYDSGPKETL
jgi:hypothetical protein